MVWIRGNNGKFGVKVQMEETRHKMEHITKEQFTGIWNYFLSLENDLSNTSRYIEPSGQEEVHSFEFAKLIILSCTEAESHQQIGKKHSAVCGVEYRRVTVVGQLWFD